MIIYNVTINVDEDVHDYWLKWMQETHIPEVLKTGMFKGHSMSKLLTRQEDETGTTYVIQYMAGSMTDYDRYQQEFAPKLQRDTQEKFGGKFVAFRTLMESI